MKHILLLLSLALLPGAVQADEPPQGQPPAGVVITAVRKQTVEGTTPIVGTLYFDKVSRVSTEVSGLVRAMPFRAGDRIDKGAVLCSLGTDFIDKEIDLARAGIEQVDVSIEKAGKDLDRYETLYRKNAATEKAYDDLVYSRRELTAQRKALVNQLETARLKRAKSTVRAPFDGIVIEKGAEIGEWVSPGALLCRLGALDELCVKVPVAEELLRFIHEGGNGQCDPDLVRRADGRYRGRAASRGGHQDQERDGQDRAVTDPGSGRKHVRNGNGADEQSQDPYARSQKRRRTHWGKGSRVHDLGGYGRTGPGPGGGIRRRLCRDRGPGSHGRNARDRGRGRKARPRAGQ